MRREGPRYGDSILLFLLRNFPLKDKARQYEVAAKLQGHYEALATEAGNLKMRATVELVTQVGEDEAALRIKRDTGWVRDVVRHMGGAR